MKPVFDPSTQVEPWLENGQLAGILVDGGHVPFPGCGIETELGVHVRGARGEVRPALDELLGRRTGVPARRGVGPDLPFEAERVFDTLGCSYREGDHLEVNTFYRRSATAARWNLELLLARAQELARADGRLLLHATGGDPFGSSWSSLHVNVAISDLCYQRLLANTRACDVALGYYLPAQISLAVVDGNGGIGEDGFQVSDRLVVFDAVFGTGTMRPHRALVVDRDEAFHNARIMCMIRALSFGRASCAGLVATQIDVLICDLMIHGALQVEPIRLSDPVAAARELASHDRRLDAAAMQRRIQETRWRTVDWLTGQLGDAFVEDLLPGARDELRFIDETLAAIEADDDAELLRRCDWARKQAMLLEHIGGRDASWSAALPALQELNVHYARLDEHALRHHFSDAAMPATHRPDPVPAETGSWLLYWVCERAARDPAFARQLRSTEVSWHGLRRATDHWADPQGDAWPWAERRCEAIELAPFRFTRESTERTLAHVDSVDALFAALGERHSHFGDYAGRSYGPDHRGAATSDPNR